MNEFEYLVIGRDPKSSKAIPIFMRSTPFQTREEAMKYAMEMATIYQSQVVAIVRHPASAWVEGPYPMCRTPALCQGAGYCKRDPACNN